MTEKASSRRSEPSGTGSDVGAVARRAAAAARAHRAAGTAGERSDAGRGRINEGGEHAPGAVIGLAVGAAAVAIVLARTIFHRR